VPGEGLKNKAPKVVGGGKSFRPWGGGGRIRPRKRGVGSSGKNVGKRRTNGPEENGRRRGKGGAHFFPTGGVQETEREENQGAERVQELPLNRV